MTASNRASAASASGFLAAFAVALVAGAPALAAPRAAHASRPTAAGPPSAESYTFAFRDAEVVQVADAVLSAVGQPYAVDPSASGRLSFRIEQRLTREQLLAAFEVVLQANGLALVRNGEQLIVTAQSKAKTAAPVRRQREAAGGAGFEIIAVPLSYAQPSEVAKALEAISAATNILYTNDRLGLMVLGGNGEQLKSTLETARIFDQSGFEDSKIRWFELSQAQATTVSDELLRIVQGAGLSGVSIVPLRRLNGLIVFARSGEALADIGRWVTRLDTAGKEAASSLWVYHPRATSAEDLARTLSSLMGGQAALETTTSSSHEAGAPPALGIAGAPTVSTATATLTATGGSDDSVRFAVDKPTNTLIVVAAPGKWVQIQRILGEIDRTPRQILIEASILEVTLNKDFEFGVDWSVLSKDLTVSSINNSSGTIGPSAPGLSVTFLNNDIEAAVHALGSRTLVQVVSAPKIIALDSRTAHLQVGDQVPVVTQSSQSRNDSNAALINTVDYRSTGVILTVTPRITGDDQLVLEVAQEVSSVGKTSTSGIDSPTIQQRRFESALVIHDGDVVALGGLIGSNRTVSNSGVPFVQDVPVLGSLFRTHSDDHGRSELIVLLKAKIIGDRAASDAAMANLFQDMQELQRHGLLPSSK